MSHQIFDIRAYYTCHSEGVLMTKNKLSKSLECVLGWKRGGGPQRREEKISLNSRRCFVIGCSSIKRLDIWDCCAGVKDAGWGSRNSLGLAQKNLSSHSAAAWRKVEERYKDMSAHVDQSYGTY